MNKLITPAVLTKYNPRKDKSVTITFETDEKNANQIMELHELMGKYGGLVFKPESQLTVAEIKEIDSLDIEASGKTKSQRLRNKLYVKHQQIGNPGDSFNNFYARAMDAFIEGIKLE